MTQTDVNRIFQEVTGLVKEANAAIEPGYGQYYGEQLVLALLNYKLQVAVQEEASRQVQPVAAAAAERGGLHLA